MSRGPQRPVWRLQRWHEWTLYLSFGALSVSGIAWLLLDTFVRVEGPFGPVQHPAEPWLLRVHGTATYVFLLAVGALIPSHIQPAWRARHNIASGAATIAGAVFLALSGLGLYYVSADAIRHGVSLLHWLVGIGATAILPCHVLLGRRSRAKDPGRRNGRKSGADEGDAAHSAIANRSQQS